jgi:hypothetical protein
MVGGSRLPMIIAVIMTVIMNSMTTTMMMPTLCGISVLDLSHALSKTTNILMYSNN